jgi:protease secretion system outer membrane protein
MRRWLTLLWGGLCLSASSSIWALDLMADFQRAMQYDPHYRAALAEKGANMTLAEQARLSYFPEANFNTQRLQNDFSGRRTVTVTQPLFSAEKLALLKMQDPRADFAQASFLTQQVDLAQRLFKAATGIILAVENQRLNQARLIALTQQTDRAKRLYAMGQGTVTDQRDLEVKLAQARAQHLLLNSQVESAAKQYAAIVGERPRVAEFVLAQNHTALSLLSLDEYVTQSVANHPAVKAAKMSEKMAELEVTRTKGALMPTVSAAYINSSAGNLTNISTGLVVNMPFQMGSVIGHETAQQNLLKAVENRRETEEKIRVEVEKAWNQVSSGVEILKAQSEAIDAARLSVEANTRSFQGGIRSSVDVVNAIQTVYQVTSDYVSIVVGQAESYLTLLASAQGTPLDALRQAQAYLLTSAMPR